MNQNFFVSVVDGERWALLSGPYPDHPAALADVKAVKDIAQELDPRTAFAAFGTASTESARPGLLNRLGLFEIGENDG